MRSTISRREALRRVVAVSAALGFVDLNSFGAVGSRGYGTDPKLLTKEIPWPLILTEKEKRVVTALADIFLPEDQLGPAASKVGVPEFIDEWISAPYDVQIKDCDIVREGLAWIDDEAKRRFTKDFADIGASE